MSGTSSDSQLAAAVSSTSLKQQLDDVAENIIKGVDETAIVQVLRLELLQKQEELEEWSHSSSHLNLLQLAVLYGRTLVTEYLCFQHRKCMEKRLYEQNAPPQDEESLFMDFLPQPAESPTGAASGDGTCSVEHAFETVFRKAKESQQGVEKLVNHPLHMACSRGDLDSLKALTKHFIIIYTMSGSNLYRQGMPSELDKYAAEVLQSLMKTVSVLTGEVSLSKAPVEGLPLELAINSGNVDCVVYILHNILFYRVWLQPSSLHLELKHSATTLDIACCLGAPGLVAMLLSALPREVVHCRDRRGQTPLHFAVWTGDTDTIRLLLEHGADVNARTSSGSSCLRLLFRCKLMPQTLEANTQLLLQYGADPTAADRSPEGQTQTPLQVLVENVVQLTFPELWKMRLVESIVGQYVRPPGRTFPYWSNRDYLQSRVRCLRLLLEAGADANVVNTREPVQMDLLQLVLTRSSLFLVKNHPDFLFSMVSTLLEFGATLCQNDDLGCVHRFLCSCVLRMQNHGPVQADFVRLFSENGVDPDLMASGLLSSAQTGGWPERSRSTHFWTCLAQRASLGGLKMLSAVRDLLHLDLDSGQVASAIYGSPVQSLRHSCKVAVWRALGHQGRRVDSLCVPDMVKTYLRSDDLLW